MKVKPPRHRWRTLPSDGNCLYGDTKEEIVEKAQGQAESLGTTVGLELWSEDHPMDYLNQGWALVGTVPGVV